MIVTVLIIVLIIVLILVLKNRENFRSLVFKSIYLSKSQACSTLSNVKELNEYNDMDFKLRKIDKKKYGNNVALHYCNRLEDFNKYDKKLLDWVLLNLRRKTPKNLSFIIQKYIERPFLVDKRKFDIRVWVLVNQEMEVFFFREGYLRTSCYEYKLDNCDDPINSQFVHLTNNAV